MAAVGPPIVMILILWLLIYLARRNAYRKK
jgi:hypothetical protein